MTMTTINQINLFFDWLWVIVATGSVLIHWRVLHHAYREYHSMQVVGVNGETQDRAWTDIIGHGVLLALQVIVMIGGVWRLSLPPYYEEFIFSKTVVSTIVVVIMSVVLGILATRNLTNRLEEIRQVKARMRGTLRTRHGEPEADLPG